MTIPNTNPREVRIERILPVPALTPDRLGQEDLLVEYSIGGAHFFQLRVPDRKAPPQVIERAVKEDAQRFAALIGKAMTL